MNKQRVKRILGQVAGWFCIFLGILGLFLPILQGFLFLAIGLLILSKSSPWAKRLLDRLRTRYPKIARQLDKLKNHARFKRLLK